MSANHYDEHKSFLHFLILIILTAFGILYAQRSDLILGGFGILWGVFGMVRLVYITQPLILPDDTGNLPQRLLFNLNAEQQRRKDMILNRLRQRDIMWWLGGAAIFLCWVIYCSISPNNIAAQNILLRGEFDLDKIILQNFVEPYVILQGLIFYFILAIIFLSSLTYAGHATYIRRMFFSLLPIFVCTAGLYALTSSTVTLIMPPWQDLGAHGGGGMMQSKMLHILFPDQMIEYGSTFVTRYLNFGALGAYGVYVLFLPVFIMAIVGIILSRRNTLYAFLVLFILGCLATLDIFWTSGLLRPSLLILGLPIIGVCWSMIGFERRTL